MPFHSISLVSRSRPKPKTSFSSETMDWCSRSRSVTQTRTTCETVRASQTCSEQRLTRVSQLWTRRTHVYVGLMLMLRMR
uniref:Uncharacterized protein n=1 Tax=Oryza brachyantha TaxID=4533 RepID=J3MH97_ORYBR